MSCTGVDPDLSELENQGASALCSLKNGLKPDSKTVRPTQDDGKADFGDISSCAEDDLPPASPPKETVWEEHVPVTDPEEELDEKYAIPKVRNPVGDEVFLFSELYRPAVEVLARYRKQALAQRVKSGRDGSYEDAYQLYKQTCRKYRTKLTDFYARVKSEVPVFAETDKTKARLLDYDPNYELRRLKARIRELEALLEEKQEKELEKRPETYAQLKRYRVSPVSFLDLPSSIKFELSLPSKRPRSSTEFACKYSDPSEELSFRKQILVNNEAGLPLFLNKSKEPETVRVGFNSLIDKLRGSAVQPQQTMTEAVILRKAFLMEFRNKPGLPGKIEKGTNPLYLEPENLASKQETKAAKVFALRKTNGWIGTGAGGIPTRLNTQMRKSEWLSLVFPDTTDPKFLALHKDTSRLIYNLADIHMKFDIPDKVEPVNIKDREDALSRNSSEEQRERQKTKNKNIQDALRGDTDMEDEKQSRDARSDSEEEASRATNLHLLPAQHGRTTTLKHAQPAYDYIYLKKDWSEDELRSFHRPRFFPLRSDLKWRVRILPLETVVNVSQNENMTAHNIFKSVRSLTLRKGKFALFEYVEKRPHLLSNYGMGSKLRRYFKGSLNTLTEFPAYVGDGGLIKFCEGEDNVPLIGQLQEGQSVAVLENNMCRAPAFAHSTRRYDFLLIKKLSKRGTAKVYLKRLDRVYTAGQQEPKKEVFIPKSRNTNTFQQNRSQAFIFNLLHERGNQVTMQELCQVFNSFNESSIRKTLKQMGCEQPRDQQYWTHPALPSRQQILEKVTPEDVCQYESMRAGQLALQDKGISITSVDKLENAVKKVKKETEDKYTQHIANWIEEQLVLTPWNLTNSYISAKLNKGMMQIDGPGDPTCGKCGYCFIKVPMKLPHGDRGYFEGTNDPSKFLSSQRIVTGTDADLRKLSMNDLMKKLLTFDGIRKDKVEGLTRWERVGLLKYLSSQAAKDGKQGSITKYARGTRLTTKMMREEYQRSVNETFDRMIRTLGGTSEYREDREEEDFPTTLDIDALPQEDRLPNPQSKDFEEDVERMEQEGLANLANMRNEMILKRQTPAEEPAKSGVFRVLRKETKIENIDKTITIKVQYIRDPKEIEEHLKRMREEETKEMISALPKLKKAATTIEESMRGDKSEERKQPRFKDEGKRRDREGENESQITCSRCGQKGHMKTNRKCPMYTAEHAEPSEAERQGMIKIGGGLKLSLSLPLIDSVPPAKKAEKKPYAEDYLKPKAKPRRRNLPDENPYDDITHRLFMLDRCKYFHRPVKKEDVPDYYDVVKTPMTLTDMNSKAKGRRYTSAQMFLEDLNLLVSNAELYNGYNHDISQEARELREEGLKLMREKELLVEIPQAMEVDPEAQKAETCLNA